MFKTNCTELKENMNELFNNAIDCSKPLIVTRKDENMVIVPQSLYDSLMETIYLMGNKKNFDHLSKSINEYNENLIKHF